MNAINIMLKLNDAEQNMKLCDRLDSIVYPCRVQLAANQMQINSPKFHCTNDARPFTFFVLFIATNCNFYLFRWTSFFAVCHTENVIGNVFKMCTLHTWISIKADDNNCTAAANGKCLQYTVSAQPKCRWFWSLLARCVCVMWFSVPAAIASMQPRQICECFVLLSM